MAFLVLSDAILAAVAHYQEFEGGEDAQSRPVRQSGKKNCLRYHPQSEQWGHGKIAAV